MNPASLLGCSTRGRPPGRRREPGSLRPNPTANLAGAERLSVNIDNRPGRHRAPGGYSPLGELKNIARESAQPAMKGAAVVAAAGGLVATLSAPASAETATDTSAVVAAPKVAAPKAAAAVGPDAATAPALALAPALSSIGYAAPAPKKAAKPKPLVIKDVVLEKARKEAATKAAAEKARKEAAAKAAASREAADRASRDSSRTSLTTPTYTQKSTVNGTSGTKSSYNWATAGQCTWGALNKWYQSEGYYPGGWTGNAMEWAWGAANAGYTVSGTPRTRSILVMQPGVHGSSSVGHVAWVTAVNGNEVTIIEMNALAGAYNYNTRTLTDISGMKYIYAP